MGTSSQVWSVLAGRLLVEPGCSQERCEGRCRRKQRAMQEGAEESGACFDSTPWFVSGGAGPPSSRPF